VAVDDRLADQSLGCGSRHLGHEHARVVIERAVAACRVIGS
jgi:hypothetical protein